MFQSELVLLFGYLFNHTLRYSFEEISKFLNDLCFTLKLTMKHLICWVCIFLVVGALDANLTIRSGPLNGTVFESAQFYKKGSIRHASIIVINIRA